MKNEKEIGNWNKRKQEIKKGNLNPKQPTLTQEQQIAYCNMMIDSFTNDGLFRFSFESLSEYYWEKFKEN